MSFHIARVLRLLTSSLIRNSFFIMLATLKSAAIGLVFWVVAARLYSMEEIGVAAAIISSMYIPLLLSRLGMDGSLTRFIPGGDRGKIFWTTIFVTTLLALILGAMMIVGVGASSFDFSIISLESGLFLGTLVALSISSLGGVTLIAVRRPKAYFLQSLILDSKILFLVGLVSIGALGIFYSVGLAIIMGAVFSLAVINRLGIKYSGFDWRYLKDSSRFSIGNYVVGIFIAVPNEILPILALNTLGSAQAALYYVSYMISSITLLVPSAIGASLFVEGSHGEDIRTSARHAIIVTFGLIGPVVLVLILFGNIILSIVGSEFTAAFGLLQVMAASTPFVSVCIIYFAVKRVLKEMKDIMILSAVISILLLGSSYLFTVEFGPIGLGYAWLVSYGIGAFFVSAGFMRSALRANRPLSS